MAQLISVVFPSANVAAIIRFSVPVTVTFSKVYSVPFNFFTFPTIYPCSIENSTPIFESPFRCKSTGLAPIKHPPGRDTFARPYFARSGPRTKNDALMVFTRS